MQSQNSSEAETQFIDLPDDDVNLWDAVEIVGESATQFKIKWDGMNPATGKPWPDSWVQKHDATPDLVQGWRLDHPRKISTASTSSRRRAKTSSTRTRKGKSRGGSETTASRRSTKSNSPVKYVSRPLSNRGPKREYDEYDEPPGAGPSNLQPQFQTRKRKHSPEVTIDDQSVSMAPPRPKKQRATKTVRESISDELNGDKYARNLRRKGAKEVPGVISDSEAERTENVSPYRSERKRMGKAMFPESESEDELALSTVVMFLLILLRKRNRSALQTLRTRMFKSRLKQNVRPSILGLLLLKLRPVLLLPTTISCTWCGRNPSQRRLLLLVLRREYQNQNQNPEQPPAIIPLVRTRQTSWTTSLLRESILIRKRLCRLPRPLWIDPSHGHSRR
ncbi:hypothetical protein DFJ43DRAFT_291464 [Lentinula guzmanii]|uniref:Chromo domain-containing protein n=1 Tax=Lentinula guzmanii TaxID=2804957 RepID=A0AA38JH75_9AGAR|nr:hypothetical protein DFJ43DRAFT_291464 [Lentinula guzmanii]